MKKESRLILLVPLINKTAKEEEEIKEILKEELNWELIVGELLHHRLGGYFYMALPEEYRKKLNKEVRKAFETIITAQKKQVKETYEILQPIIDEFDKNNIRYAGLKGVIYNATMYEIGIRRTNDTDLLVLEEDLNKLDKILRERGYIQTLMKNGEFKEASRKEKMIQIMNYHDLIPYMKLLPEESLSDRHEIDINFQFDSKENDITKKIFDIGTETYESEYLRIKGLPWKSNLAHLCIHFYREASNTLWTKRRRDMVLYKVVDIMNMIRYLKDKKEDINEWPQFMESLGLSKPAYYTLYVVSEFYDDPLIKSWMNNININDKSFVKMINTEKQKEKIEREETFFDSAFTQIYSI